MERLLKSLVTPSYASCTTENAAEALDDNFPQTENISGTGVVRLRPGEVEPAEDGRAGIPGGCNDTDEDEASPKG